ncbi:helix-turn-helix domain-containing protein [Kangiella japonica]|uniref:Helix-turn-helix domain-containing protein n=1 Tax=Kangiella japonica TaxID=647384 RepID=A0ABN0SYP1_9GAMM
MKEKKIAFLVYEGMELLDMAGSQTAFYEGNQFVNGSYRLIVVGINNEIVVSESGTQIKPCCSLDSLGECHTLVIPGGKGARLNSLSQKELQRLRELIEKSERVVSICTGAFLLAKAGLPEKTKIATHWAFAKDLKSEFPELLVDESSLFIQDDKYWSSAGVTSCIDLTLKLIELDLGKLAAMHVAKYMVVYLRRAGSQQQYSDLLSLQSPKDKRLLTVLEWLKDNLEKRITVDMIADRANMSERQLYRVFINEVGFPPAHYLEELRMEVASTLLVSSEQNIKAIALSVGYRSHDGFKRAFQRRYSISPLKYRQVFSSSEVG